MNLSAMTGIVLVTLQFVIAAVLVLACPRPPAWWTIPLFVLAALVAIWAWVTIGLRRIRILPGVNEQTRLVTWGPYRLIRHPMYAGLILLTAATLPNNFAVWKLLLWAVLCGVLVAKSVIEERAMVAAFPQYRDYQKHTYAMIPWCW